jgi:hypothetical protein|tara:strand:- start:6736 stop:6972 length:237 start_codon:yes stop_codon:yes gene_type:complete
MRAYGHWVILKHFEEKTVSGIISNEGAAMEVVSIGEQCPEEFKTLIGKKTYYKPSRSALPMNGYICIHWQDVTYSEEL